MSLPLSKRLKPQALAEGLNEHWVVVVQVAGGGLLEDLVVVLLLLVDDGDQHLEVRLLLDHEEVEQLSLCDGLVEHEDQLGEVLIDAVALEVVEDLGPQEVVLVLEPQSLEVERDLEIHEEHVPEGVVHPLELDLSPAQTEGAEVLEHLAVGEGLLLRQLVQRGIDHYVREESPLCFSEVLADWRPLKGGDNDPHKEGQS